MDETNEAMLYAARITFNEMMAAGLSPAEICLEFFWMGHESGHICAEEATQENPLDTDSSKVTAGYL